MGKLSFAMFYFYLVFFVSIACGAEEVEQGINHKLLPLFPQGRIVGGRTTDVSEVPYQLQLEDQGFQFCGASIISEHFALTAAHCTDGRSSYGLQVRSSSSDHASGGTVTPVSAIFQHPLYSSFTTDYDISVLRLASGIPLGPNARPVTLASAEPQTGDYAVVSGWGIQVEGSYIQPRQLQSVQIPIIDRSICTSAYDQKVTQRMICAGTPGQDSCQGDSGGPLVINGVQVGVVSWGYGCARPGYPGVYSNIANLRSFINMFSRHQAKWS